MANPNPFLFGVPPAGGAEPPNPFLGGGDPSAAANPFGGGMANPFGGGMAAPVMHQAQPQYGAFATPQPASDASNPFASFCAPAQPMQPPSSLFGDTSAYYAQSMQQQQPQHQQSMQQQQPQHQQHYGQFGQYSQVTADSFSQPNVTASVQSPPVPQPSNDSPKINPFAAAMDTTPFEQVEAPSPPVLPQSTKKHSPDSTAEKKLSINSEDTRATEIIPNSQEEIPPPPPLITMQEETKVLSQQSTDENLPPPPAQEALTDDGPLPPPPSTSDEIVDLSVKNDSTADLMKGLDGVHIDSEKLPEISVDLSLENEIKEPTLETVSNEQCDKGEGSGFGGIFSNDLLDTGDTMKAAVSVSDLTPEKSEDLDNDVALDTKDDIGDSVTNIMEDETSKPGEDVTVKANSIGASLFGGTEEPVSVSANDADDYLDSQKINDFNHKAASSSSSSENNTPQKPPMSTGDAIFSDMPSVPQVASTGAAIFGMSEDSGRDTTGAAIFGVEAPRSIRPQLGQMTGWDDAFDKKFDTAITQEIGDAFDPFGASGLGGSNAQAFGADDFISGNFPAAPSNTPGIARREDAFGQAPMTDDLNNPFLSVDPQKPMGADQVDEACDGPLYDDDTSKPLEPFPRIKYDGGGWEMYIRHPPKKKLTAQRYYQLINIHTTRNL